MNSYEAYQNYLCRQIAAQQQIHSPAVFGYGITNQIICKRRTEMNWVTKDEVEKAAEESELATVRCSRKHWAQLRDASFKELIKDMIDEKVSLGTAYCALCRRNSKMPRTTDCELCTLAQHDAKCSCKDSKFDRALDAFNAITFRLLHLCGSANNAKWQEWQKAASEMVDCLAELEKKLLGEEKPKPKHKVGNRYERYESECNIYRLVLCNVETETVCLIHEKNFNRWEEAVSVKNHKIITEEEWEEIVGYGYCKSFELIKENKNDKS